MIAHPPPFRVSRTSAIWDSPFPMLLVLAAAVSAGALIASGAAPALMFGGILALLFGLVFLKVLFDHPEWGVYALVFIAYTNLADVLIRFHGAPSFTKALMPTLLVLVIYRWAVHRERPVNISEAALAFFLLGLISSVSLFFARDVDSVTEALDLFTKDAVLALVTVMLMRGGNVLRGVIWSILAGILFLGTIGVFKYATGDLDNEFWGFAQSTYGHIAGEVDSHRLTGTIADPNFYAALLALAVPLALERLLHERRKLLKLLAAAALLLALACIGLTASRGGLLALAVVAGAALLIFRPRFWYLVPLALPLSLLLLPLVPAEYLQRYEAMLDMLPGFGGRTGGTEVSIQGRLGEWAAAWAMFLDHPLLGIGWGNYETNFETYTVRLGMPLRGGVRQAHSLYLEIAAERGLLGLVAFLVLLAVAALGVFRARRHALQDGAREVAQIATAIGMATLTLITAMVFLHDAYPRMLWLLLAICIAMPRIVSYGTGLQDDGPPPGMIYPEPKALRARFEGGVS
jgi:O-antigen ligase